MKKFICFVRVFVPFSSTACRLPGLLLNRNTVSPESQYIFEIPDNPITVTSLDYEHQVEDVITTDGGN